ncbi:hypothetical protein BUALT_Bualt13G0035800 [Buddleja alternifolia]|uniref:Terpene synthase metal-binding domain-containing protein n=1 Tax=Buddleja alternifolia TaxID=168488 RepID=A0AAV6WVD7_9LAMI|nr:hypothetical protein BUALT_Bualt13G0035800 [Buddleja alternifolia]
MDEDNKFAKTLISDINGLLSLYEASLIRWWKESNIMSKLPYMRDRVMEFYFWTVGIQFEPEYSFSRIACAKALVMIVVLNDTYGNYATLDELEISRRLCKGMHTAFWWDIKEIDQLPDYMKAAYQFIFGVREEYYREVPKHETSYGVSCVIETLEQLATSYYKKAKWYMGQKTPTFQDHISDGPIGSAAVVVLMAFFVDMESASKEAFDWVTSVPKIVEAAGLLTRRRNDTSTYEVCSSQPNEIFFAS